MCFLSPSSLSQSQTITPLSSLEEGSPESVKLPHSSQRRKQDLTSLLLADSNVSSSVPKGGDRKSASLMSHLCVGDTDSSLGYLGSCVLLPSHLDPGEIGGPVVSA